MLVEERRWLTEDELLEGPSLAQAVPGPNALNLAVFSGHRLHGPAGAALAEASVLSRAAPGPSTLFVLLLGFRAARWGGAAVATAAIFLPGVTLMEGPAPSPARCGATPGCGA